MAEVCSKWHDLDVMLLCDSPVYHLLLMVCCNCVSLAPLCDFGDCENVISSLIQLTILKNYSLYDFLPACQ